MAATIPLWGQDEQGDHEVVLVFPVKLVPSRRGRLKKEGAGTGLVRRAPATDGCSSVYTRVRRRAEGALAGNEYRGDNRQIIVS